MINLAVNGAAGRMGQRVVALAQEGGRARVVAAVVRPGDPRIGKDAGTFAGIPSLEVPFTAALPDEEIGAAIDFSDPDASLAFVMTCARRRIPCVVATTGFHEKNRAQMREAAREIPLFLAPNLSIGVALVTRLVADAARALGFEADIEIAETHHRKKKDSPSGTALHLAHAIAAARGQSFEEAAVFGRKGVSSDERPRGEIAIHALRLGDVVGEHTVSFGFGAERIEIAHKAHSRDVFARGALRAALFLTTAAPGLYGPPDLLRASGEPA